MKTVLPLLALLSVCSTGVLAQESQTREIVRSNGETSYRPSGPAPAFAALDTDGNRSISSDEAVGYALLANDFIKADANRDGRISQREYDRWASQP